MVLLDSRRNHTANTDAVTTHFDGPLPSFGVEKSRAHRLTVLGAEVKHLTDFDAAVRFQLALIAARARIARDGKSQIGKRRGREVALLINLDKVGVGFVGAGHRATHSLHREIRHDTEL